MELFVILSTILVVLAQGLSCQKLVAVEVGAKLRYRTASHSSLYDGDDTIFILGGSPYSRVYSYSVSQDTLTTLATFENQTYFGFATFNDEGDILYMGGYDGSINPDGNIYKLELNSLNLKVVQTNRNFRMSRGIKAVDGSNTLFIPARNGTMYCLNLSTYERCGSIRLLATYHTVRPFVYEGQAYLTGTDPEGFIEKVNLGTLESELIDAKLSHLHLHELVFDGKYAYIIGSAEGSNNGLIRLNPQNMEHEFFTVENFPVNASNPNSAWYAGSAVYVEKVHRIYFSGGQTYSGTSTSRDEIWYIDLTPISEPIPSTTTEFPISTTLNPDIFTCRDKPNGLYPHPYDCAQFIGCRNGTEDFFECPAPLLFNPILLACTSPEDVDCDISCVGKPDGSYVHPHDCSLFIICNDQVLEVYKCPAPLLFDPELKRCNYPDEVQCKSEA